MKTMGIDLSKENLNPLSSKGRLAFSSFGLSLAAIVLFNLVVWAAIRGQLIPARMALDRERTLAYYVLWFIFATLGFACVTNTFIKRWASILGERELPKILKSVLRFSLLSPLLAYAVTLITFAFFPRGPLLETEEGGSKAGNFALLFGALALSVAVSTGLPVSLFGLERIDFRSSLEPIVAVQSAPLKYPKPGILKPILAAATPGLRYVFWLASDIVRTRMLSSAVGLPDSPLCRERLGYLGVEVNDCFFSNLRKMATVAPIVSPYFALYFETLYRQEAASNLKIDPDPQLSPGTQQFAFSLLMLSNQLELLEPGPIYVERTHLLRPSALLHAYGSPEFPFVEAGQDIQRIGLVEKLIPVFELQLAGARKFLETEGRSLGPAEVTIEAEVRDMEVRIAAVKRDPLMIGKK